MNAPDASTQALVMLGLILAISLFTDTLARRTGLPQISLLVLVGVGFAALEQLGPGGAGPPLGALREPLISVALVMVAFLLGGELTAERVRALGRPVLVLSLTVALVSAAVVGVGLVTVGFPLTVAVALAAISVATDPAVVLTAIRETAARSRLASVLEGVVAIDDVWGILAFGVSMALLGWLGGADAGLAALGHAAHELGGAVVLGVAIGLPAAWLTGRLQAGEPTRTEALAVILLIVGLAGWLEVSELLAAVIAGCVIVNVAPHHEYSFVEIEWIEWPFLVFFFVLAGASIDLAALPSVLPLLAAYVGLRLLGRYVGARLGVAALGRSAGAGLTPHLGLALTPQAGVAMGMALLAAERLPDHGGAILATVVAGTILFETTGPILVERVLRTTGDDGG